MQLQLVSQRYLTLSRDNALWKIECFNHSKAEALRLRQQRLNVQDASLAELRNAYAALPGSDLTPLDVAQLMGRRQPLASRDPAAEERIQRSRALASWEPGYPTEKLDYYDEYIQRHAPVAVAWMDLPKLQTFDKDEVREATGVGMHIDQQASEHVIAPLDDGSVCIWDISARSTYLSGGGGRLVAQSRPGLLTGQAAEATTESHAIMTETGAVECVSIDSSATKGYFAVQNLLQEVDLNTLQISSTKQYPFPITALSEQKEKIPLTVGTNMTIHLHDPRDPAFAAAESGSAGELIGGALYSHATLAQPGPLSVLHHDGFGPSDESIWVAGRFTSLLNYDRRFFPRLRGTVFSGARIASLSPLPHPFIPRSLDLLRNPGATISEMQAAKSRIGTSILVAGEYKGKGSLELFGLPNFQSYMNRQTASASKLLCAAPHGGRIVFSDGDGQLKWMERDGFSHVRTFNINDALSSTDADGAQAQDATSSGIWSSTASEMPGQGDIVQKMVPLNTHASYTGNENGRLDVNQNNLLLWTGDGRLGVLGFGHGSPFGEDEWHDAVEDQHLTAEQRARADAEKQYGMAMRRALERNADEVRFVRGLGMGFMRQ